MNKLHHKGIPMIKTVLIASLLGTLCGARENPFFATSTNPTNTVTSQKNSYKPPLTSMTYSFPKSARVLQEATFTFQNLDGSIETRTIEIDHSIDWRSPLVLSQSSPKNSESPSTSPTSTQTNTLAQVSTVSQLDFITFKPSKNNLLIQTKDQMIRSFTLSDPSCVIVDFRHDGLFNTAQLKLNNVPFVSTKVTNHGKFARVKIVLDGNHACKVLKEANGVNVACK